MYLTLYIVSQFTGHTVANISLYKQSVHYSSNYSPQQLVDNVCTHRVIIGRCTLYYTRYSDGLMHGLGASKVVLTDKR